ncbi:Protein FAR1-RELATED SEQUENCE 6 [Platanthera zijinensis]|uniref:Protein FAR1-RELATED SEQUENCE n=1 Tax=Platanthera zijinensis TaxID=2320716 RepID=A0AAP0GAG1_9ASPA
MDSGDMEFADDDPNVDSSNVSGGYEGVPEVGTVFKTHHEVSKFYKSYARRVGFGVSVRRSSFSKEGLCLYLELMCCKGGGNKRAEPKFRKRTSATTNCPARIRAKLWADGLLHLELANLDHNHAVSPSMARFLIHNRQLAGFATKQQRHESDAAQIEEEEQEQGRAQAPANGLSALEQLLFGEGDRLSSSERGRLKLGEGDADALRLFFTRMQARNSNFFNIVDLDGEGCARNVFWADSRSRAAYQYYNDAVSLDMSCVTNRFDLPLATFVGANHHGQPVLLGCALLSDETPETYRWLLKAWIACMSGHVPKAVITDHCKGIQIAVSDVLPGVRHRFCLWQIMKRAPEKLGGLAEYRAVHKAMQKAVYDSLSVEEFEIEWGKMIDIYGLRGNDWMSSLNECRHFWAPAYLKDAFWAGLSPTQRNESLTAFFDGYVDGKTSLKQFVGKYEMALQSKYEKEAQADFETFHKRRPSVSKFFMEEQLSTIYTMDMFKKFQDEIEAIMYCHVSVIKVEGAISVFDVKECIFLEDGKRTTNKNHGVLYNSDEKDVQCICGSFQFTGILCRHALSVFKLQQVHEIPTQYVLDRWKKDFKRLRALNGSSEDVVSSNRIARYDYLSMRCLQLVEVGILSDKYQLALKLMREMEKFLLSDGTHEGTQPSIIARISRPDCVANENSESAVPFDKGTEMRRRRGRPLQDARRPLGTSKDQMEEQIGSNALPLASQQASQMNPQQFVGNQPAVRPSIVYMFPGGFNPHTFGSGAMMPWMYHQMHQSVQKPPKDPSSFATAQARRKRKISRRLKTAQTGENSHCSPLAPPPMP